VPLLDGPPPLDALCAEGAVAVFLDFDGTLVDIARHPDSIVVPHELGARLETLGARFGGRVALISGRGPDDIQRHLGRPAIAMAGSHGIARMTADGRSLGGQPEPLPDDAVAQIRTFCARHGFELEAKPHGAALHYRAAPHLEALGEDFARRLAADYGLQVKRGKCVVELVRQGADKGGAVRAFMEAEPFAGAKPVFVGDDLTDEDGFAAVAELGGFGVLVGDREPTHAHFALPDVSAVHDWLGL
jgi:trehalose 6-phosphate phosphatase